MSQFVQMLNVVQSHGVDCAELAFERLGEVGFDWAAVELTRTAVRQQIGDDMHTYGMGKVTPKLLSVLTTKSCEAFEKRLNALLATRTAAANAN